ncbi:MAG: malonyl-ACP O-methyltransferase BioC [Burkholderiaceae bacterium]|jgi:malonyl-CoA O-methyltransferase|nr:malonyl-ACP O-methyltransferase BioC [Burkholderiaceae bacterium]
MSQTPIYQDIYHLDKARIRASFDRAANTYDAAAVMQKLVREEMLSRLDLVSMQPARILDAGCGTGHASLALMQKYPKAQLVSLDLAMGMLQKTQDMKTSLTQRIKQTLGFNQQHLLCADIEQFPLADASLELVWSNLAIQWCNDLDAAFTDMHRVLNTDGLLMFSTLGPDTLKELRAASSVDGEHVHVSRFIDMHDIGDALVRAGFAAPVLDVEHITLTYDDVIAVMRDLKSIGAHNATEGRSRGLQGRGFLKQLTENYERFRQDGKLPATFEVIYGHAWKPAARPKTKIDLEAGFAPVTFHAKK